MGRPDQESGNLTSPFLPAYRSSVTRGRRVPHVHVATVEVPPANRGASRACADRWCRPNRWTRSDRRHPTHRALGPKPRSEWPLIPSERTREQAYVPAEQPPPPQGARIPATHAHARRPLDPVRASPQGPQEPGRLSSGSPGPVPSRSCFPPSIASPAVTTFAVWHVPDAAATPTRWWSTWSPPGARTRAKRRDRRVWGSWSDATSAIRSSGTASNAGSGTCAVTASPTCRPAARSSSGPSCRPGTRRTRNSEPTSTVVSDGLWPTADPGPGRGGELTCVTC